MTKTMKTELIRILADELGKQLNTTIRAHHLVNGIQIRDLELARGCIAFGRLAEAILEQYDIVEKPIDTRRMLLQLLNNQTSLVDDILAKFHIEVKENWAIPAGVIKAQMDTENVSGVEALFISKVQVLIGGVQFERDFFQRNIQGGEIFNLINKIAETVWMRYPVNQTVAIHALTQHWVKLFSIVQNRCSNIYGFAVLRNFQIINNTSNNMLVANLAMLPSIGHVDPIMVTWNLHSLQWQNPRGHAIQDLGDNSSATHGNPGE